MQEVREAPFAFPWRPSFYLLCFPYPFLSLSLSLPLSLSLSLSLSPPTQTPLHFSSPSPLWLSPFSIHLFHSSPSFTSILPTFPSPLSNPHFSLLPPLPLCSLSFSRVHGVIRAFTVSAATLVSTDASLPPCTLVPGQPSTLFFTWRPTPFPSHHLDYRPSSSLLRVHYHSTIRFMPASRVIAESRAALIQQSRNRIMTIDHTSIFWTSDQPVSMSLAASLLRLQQRVFVDEPRSFTLLAALQIDESTC